jgi:hypothetical protein
MDSPQDSTALPAEGFPIRTSTDQSLVGGSPWLIAATHVLRRLLEPRHPPHALSSLVTLNSGLPSRSSSGAAFEVEIQTLRRFGSRETSLCDALLYPSYSVVRVLRPAALLRRRAGTRVPGLDFGGADRSRTDDIQLAKLALYQLSYSPIKPVVGTGGPRWI